MTHRIIGLFVGLLIISTSAQAGFFDRLVDSVERGVENAVTGRVANKAADQAGQATDAVINPEPSAPGEPSAPVEASAQIEGSAQVQQSSTPVQAQAPSNQGYSNASDQSQAAGSLGGLGGMLQALQQKAEHDQQYRFDFEVESEVNDGSNVNRLVQGYSTSALSINTEENQKMILDMKNEAMLMINPQEKSLVAMSTQFMKQMASMGANMAKKELARTTRVDRMEKTGRTKDILGFNAEEWVFESGEDKGEMWITSDIDFDFVAFNKNILNMFDNGSGQLGVDFSQIEGKFPQGFPLEMTSYTNGKLETSTKVVRVDQSPAVVDLTGYRSQSMMGN